MPITSVKGDHKPTTPEKVFETLEPVRAAIGEIHQFTTLDETKEKLRELDRITRARQKPSSSNASDTIGSTGSIDREDGAWASIDSQERKCLSKGSVL